MKNNFTSEQTVEDKINHVRLKAYRYFRKNESQRVKIVWRNINDLSDIFDHIDLKIKQFLFDKSFK